MNAISHTFSRSEVREAQHIFIETMKKYFGELWTPKSESEYRGKSWDCRSMIAIDPGLWRLCQMVKHTGSQRVFGKIEVKDAGSMLRFIIFYMPNKESSLII